MVFIPRMDYLNEMVVTDTVLLNPTLEGEN